MKKFRLSLSVALTIRTFGYYGAFLWALHKKDQAAIDAVMPERQTICVEKSWNGLHYLMTGTSDGGKPPLSYVVLGGTQIGSDRGCGPAQYLTPAQVKEADQALQKLNVSELRKQFDLKKLAAEDIYPYGGHRFSNPPEQETDDEWQDYKMYIERLTVYFHKAAHDNRAILFWLS